jgi:uncharacterized protein
MRPLSRLATKTSTQLSRRLFLVAPTLVALTLMAMSPQAGAQDGKPAERTISVSASGTAAAAPDRAVVATGVSTEAATAREAMSLNTVAMKKLLDGLKAQRIEAKDIQTSNLQLNPRYADGKGGRAPTITGYQALNQVRIIVRELPRLGDILDQAVTLGANQMNGISFEVSNAETLQDEARKAAMVNARRRAELYATAAGVALGPVLTISETLSGAPAPRMYAGRAAMAEAVAVEPGSVDLQVQVHVTYALK